RAWPDSIGGCSAGVAINSDFGLRSSGLGFGMPRTDFRAALGEPPRRPDHHPISIAGPRQM
ncbi:MAG: hypothetical protein WCQ21_35995, partial [Verrucomicrobiota bacterium]